MVKAIPSDRTDEPLRISVLPWRSWCDRPIPNAHRSKAADEDVAIDTISLGWRMPSPRHALCNGGLPDIDAELEQFAMNPRCTPKRVRDTHGSNELTNLQRRLWSATPRPRSPAPIGSEAGAVP